MSNSNSSFAWAERLNCPKEILTNRVKNIISAGVSGHIWDLIETQLHPTKEVNEIKANILLHTLKTGQYSPATESIEKLRNLKVQRENLASSIAKLKNDIARKEFENKQAIQQHRKNIKYIEELQIKNNILNAKYLKTESDMKDLNELQTICDDLKPPSSNEIDPYMVEDCLALVSTLTRGVNKKEVWKQVNVITKSIRIPVLWNLLIQKRLAINEELYEMIQRKEEDLDNNYDKQADYEIAKLLSKHIEIECDYRVHKINRQKHQESVMEYIEKIETTYNNKCSEFKDWLPLMLECKQKELIQSNMQNVVRNFQIILTKDVDPGLIYNQLSEVAADLKHKVNSSFQDLNITFQLLKNARSFITESKNALMGEILKLQRMDLNYDQFILNRYDELRQFYDEFDIKATRKISLKGDVNAYRHLTICINEASTIVTVPSNHDQNSPFPMIKMPIYYLMDCVKSYATKKQIQNIMESLHELINQLESVMPSKNQFLELSVSENEELIEKIMSVDLICDNTNKSIQKNFDIMDQWVNQTVQTVLLTILGDLQVNGATLKDWLQRYTMLIYMKQQNL